MEKIIRAVQDVIANLRQPVPNQAEVDRESAKLLLSRLAVCPQCGSRLLTHLSRCPHCEGE